MDTTREPELEQAQQVPAAPAAVAAPSGPAAIPAGPLSPAGVMALQRLVGNAAVAGMIADQAGSTGLGAIGGTVADVASAAAGGGSASEAAQGGIGAAAAEAAQAAAGGGSASAAAEGSVGGVGAAAGEAAQGVAGGVGAEAAQGVAGGVGAAAGEAAQGVAGGVGAAAAEAAQGVAGGVGAAAAEAAQGGVGAAAGQAAQGVAGGVGAAAAEAAQGVAGGVGAAAGQAAQGVAGGAGAAAAGAALAGAAGAGGATAASARAAGGATGAAGGGGAAGAAQTAAGGSAPGAAGAAAAAPAQAAAGGAAGGGAAGAAAPAPRRDPSEDPNFQAMKGKAGAAGSKAKAHQPAAAGAAAAQAAAAPPGNEVASQAAGAQVEEMGAQQPGTFDRKAFIAAVQKAIDAAAPKNLEEADDFKGSGKAAQVKGEVGQLVKGGKKDAEKDIKTATDAPPDASKAKPKDVTPLAPEKPGEATSSVGAASAMPGQRPPEDTDLSAGPAQVDEEMEREGVTEEQLANSNEPDFTAALDARQTAKEHSATAPAEYRAQEQEVLAKGRDEAAEAESAGLAGMHGSKVAAFTKVVSQQGEAKSQDEAKRAKVAADIQAIYDKTKTDVTGILTSLDGKVDAAFTSGEESARKQFEEYVGAKMDAYKDDRYSGFWGGARWLKDKLFGMPDEVNVFYSQGRTAYLTAMDAVIGQVADIVGGELNAARMRIAQGKTEVRNYVAQLPQDLQKVGKDAEGKLEEQFDQLSSDVDNKQDALVDTLAQKYVASRDALDSRIEELKAANKGLVDKALDAVVGVVKTILKLKDMLLNVLAKAADVIGDIISDPIGFLGNLIGGIKDGLDRFVGNIATHLQNGLMGWLFGALGDAGIKMPKSFDLAGIFELVMDVLGLTYRNIRGRVAKVVGEPVVEKMEQTVDVFKMLVTDGPAALWTWIKDKVGDFQEMVFGGLKEFIIERVIKGGVMWLLSLLNPAAAFIKACKAIYDIVMFIVERGSQIMEFVNSVLDSIGAIARGQLSVAAEKVEGALARALPLAIGFLASLLGLGGISDKIREAIDKVRKPIEKVVDTVVMGAVKGFKKMFGGAIGWVKDKAAKGKAWATGKIEAGKAWAVGKAKGIKDRLTGKGGENETAEAGAEMTAADPDRQARLETATNEVHTLMEAEDATVESVEAKLPAIKQRYALTSLELVREDEYTLRPHAVINPTLKGPPGVLFTPAQLAAMSDTAKKWAAQIKKKGEKGDFLADPRLYLLGDPTARKSPRVTVGEALESAAGPPLEDLAAEGGLTLLQNVYMQAKNAKEDVGGSQHELDYLMLGATGVVEIVSAKLDPGAFKPSKDKKNLSKYYDCPVDVASGLTAWLNANSGPTKRWNDAETVDVVSSAGRMPIGEFRTKYLSKVPIDTIKITRVTPGPEDPLKHYQLSATAPQLIDEMIKLITPLL